MHTYIPKDPNCLAPTSTEPSLLSLSLSLSFDFSFTTYISSWYRANISHSACLRTVLCFNRALVFHTSLTFAPRGSPSFAGKSFNHSCRFTRVEQNYWITIFNDPKANLQLLFPPFSLISRNDCYKVPLYLYTFPKILGCNRAGL